MVGTTISSLSKSFSLVVEFNESSNNEDSLINDDEDDNNAGSSISVSVVATTMALSLSITSQQGILVIISTCGVFKIVLLKSFLFLFVLDVLDFASIAMLIISLLCCKSYSGWCCCCCCESKGMDLSFLCLMSVVSVSFLSDFFVILFFIAGFLVQPEIISLVLLIYKPSIVWCCCSGNGVVDLSVLISELVVEIFISFVVVLVAFVFDVGSFAKHNNFFLVFLDLNSLKV